jgi:hypothetical protein
MTCRGRERSGEGGGKGGFDTRECESGEGGGVSECECVQTLNSSMYGSVRAEQRIGDVCTALLFRETSRLNGHVSY